MKFAIFAAFALESAFALQGGGYLSQLNGAHVINGGNPAFSPPPSRNMMADLYSSSPPGSRFGAAGIEEESGANVAFFPTPVGSMDVQSSTASNDLLQLWSDQVSVELSASQLYLSASIWFRSRDMHGMAAWMLEESDEERGHGLAILEFAMKRGFPVTLKELDAPRNNWQSPVEVWVDILNAEQTNTQNLLRLAAAADGCGTFCWLLLVSFFVERTCVTICSHSNYRGIRLYGFPGSLSCGTN
jgi:ferritin